MKLKKRNIYFLVLGLSIFYSFKSVKPKGKQGLAQQTFTDSPGLDSLIALGDSAALNTADSALASLDTSSATQDTTLTIFGTASYYHNMFEGRKTANGQIFRQSKLTAAHRTLPLGTRVRVTNIKKNLSVEVLINDRMGKSPHEIDLTTAAAKKLNMIHSGWAKVKIEVIN